MSCMFPRLKPNTLNREIDKADICHNIFFKRKDLHRRRLHLKLKIYPLRGRSKIIKNYNW